MEEPKSLSVPILPSALSLLLRSKSGLHSLTSHQDPASPFVKSEALSPIPCDILEWSEDGSLFAVSHSGNVSVRSGSEQSEILNIAVPAKAMSFSPKGKFLVTWETFVKAKNSDEQSKGNLVIWKVESGEEVMRVVQRQFKGILWPPFKWSEDENLAAYMVADGVKLYRGNMEGDKKSFHTIHAPKIGSFSIAPGRAPYKISTFVPEGKGKPAKIEIHRCKVNQNDFECGVTSFRSAFQAQEMSHRWAPDGSVLLGVLSTDLDATGQSYYGRSGMVLLHSNGKFSCSVAPPKEGAVHDVQWAPTSSGMHFAVCSGATPALTALFSSKGEQKFLFGTAPRNTIVWSPQGRFLCVAGFGNMAGDMDFWDVKESKHLGSNNASCAVKFGWSPDSRYFMTATCAPRMNVDNGISIFKYNGEGPIYTQEIEFLYDAKWRPSPSGTFPDICPSPRKSKEENGQLGSSNGSSTQKKEAYRPPNARGGGTLAAMMRAERETKTLGPMKVGEFEEQKVGKAGKSKKKPNKNKKEEKNENVRVNGSEEKESGNKIKMIRKLNLKLKKIDSLKEKVGKSEEALAGKEISLVGQESEIRQQLAKLEIM